MPGQSNVTCSRSPQKVTSYSEGHGQRGSGWTSPHAHGGLLLTSIACSPFRLNISKLGYLASLFSPIVLRPVPSTFMPPFKTPRAKRNHACLSVIGHLLQLRSTFTFSFSKNASNRSI